MGARHKLNVAYFNGCLLFALGFGIATGSFLVGLITLVILLAGGLHAGNIRPDPW